MEKDIITEEVCKIVGQLYLESRLKVNSLLSELEKSKKEKEDLLKIVQGQAKNDFAG